MSHDERLIARIRLAQAGDAAAADQIARWLLEWARARLRKLGDDGEDLAGVFAARMVANRCRRLDRLLPGVEPDAYLSTALRNLVVNWKIHETRRRNRCISMEDAAEVLERPDPAPIAADPLHLLMAHEAGAALWAAVRELSEVNQRIVHLRLQGWMHHEIAAALGISHGAARKRWESIAAQLRKRLAD